MKKHIIRSLILVLLLIGFGCESAGTNDTGLAEQSADNETVETNTPETSNETEDAEGNQIDKKHKKANGTLTVDYIDAGQGDATLFHYEDNTGEYTMLYDTGDWLGDEVVPFLQDKGIDKLDLVIVSHPHADHIGQLANVMDHFTVDEVWMSGNEANSEVFAKAMTAVLDSDADYDEPEAGSIYDLGPISITVLHPETLTEKLNEDSLSIHLALDEVAFVFTGDAYKSQEQMMMDGQATIEADFLQLGHHGSDTSSSAGFVDAVQPDYAIYSAGVDNSYGHPHQEVVSLFEEKGIPLYGTDIHGTITVTTDGITADITTEREREIESNAAKTDSADDTEADDADNTTGCIDLNKASEAELMEIKHIGEARAKTIAEHRPFDAVDDLIQIKGIGDKMLADIKEENKACVGGD